MTKFNLNPDYENKQIKGLRKLYNLREKNLSQAITLLNEPYMRTINKRKILAVQKKITTLYNSLTDISRFIERGQKKLLW